MITENVQEVISAINKQGGRALLVGGAVRDHLLGDTEPKDFDIEVYGMTVNTLTSILRSLGRVSAVGKSFGVLKLYLEDGTDLDVSLPRRENKTGRGHKGFIIEADSTMTPQEAAARRDFTVNALAFDAESGTIKDYFEGLEDMDKGILRHTSEAFSEDPLRVLRGMQFAARFNWQVHPETAQLCNGLLSEFNSLPKERVWSEWQKLTTKAIKPSAGLDFLRQVGWTSCFPGIESASGEDADRAMQIAARDNLNDTDKSVLVLAAICRKVENANELLLSLGTFPSIHTRVMALMEDGTQAITLPEVRKLAVEIQPENIRMLSRVLEAENKNIEAKRLLTISAIENFSDKAPEAIVLGRHLIAEAIATPGPEMGRLLNRAFKAQLDGLFFNVEDGVQWCQTHNQ